MNTDASFQEALLRARQLAAKIAPAHLANAPSINGAPSVAAAAAGGSGGIVSGGNGTGGIMASGRDGSDSRNGSTPTDDTGSPSNGTKRSFDDAEGFDSQAKRLNIGARLAEMKGGGGGGGSNNGNHRPQRDQLYLSGAIFGGEKTLDIMLPGNKVGIIIGRGGENIRNLQERAGVKMMILQESKTASDMQKQLRISGPPEKVDYAEQLVKDMLVQKEIDNVQAKSGMMGPRGGGMPPMGHGGFGGGDRGGGLDEYGSSSRITYQEMPISPQVIGLVIGKAGENIRRIQCESRCKVQFDPQKTDNQGNKICQFTGTQESIKQAMDMVNEVVNSASHILGPVVSGANVEEVRLLVPASKTGSVIGRNGETIRAFKQQSQCNIELDKNFVGEPDERCFIIRGSADKVPYAQQLVSDKVGGNVNVISSTLAQKQPYYGDQMYNPYMLSQGYGSNSTAASAANYYRGQPNSSNSNDASRDGKGNEDYQAAWAAYYAQYAAAQQQQGGGAAAAAGGGGGGAPTATDPSAGVAMLGNRVPASASEVPIYQQWIQYYHSLRRPEEAQALEDRLAEFQQAQGDRQGQNGRGSD